ncbi:hypothetical protein [Flagellimonas flava]|uniref:Uncharacterized protein n=1 Tax=Flagellimonas flava TaxID=570519 RepID=A0A1M5J6I4_9FLAO|nr:hypothetical protein [Allomuricauda flava]SHG36152.1 hypothetical protein SAMN04488116_1159 [Allomuricauda flava]
MPKKKNQIIVLAQSLEQPRIVKRIIEKSSEFDSVKVYGFTRKIHAVHNYSVLQDYDNIDITIVGSMANSKYASRAFMYLKLIRLLYKNHGFGQKRIYAFGLDLRGIAGVIPNAKIEYEISDIMWLYKTGAQRKILSANDIFLAKRSNKVIFTSKGFYNSYYAKHVKPDKVLIKENKFKSYDKVTSIEQIKSDKIRIAYIGAFRYSKIIEYLLKTVANNAELQLNFYGDGNQHIVETIKSNAASSENITYNGAFKNPDDLERIYEENNLNFVVYDNTLDNEKVAMPNKFYESGFFNVPIACATNTYVGERVLEQNMGWIVDAKYDAISTFLNSLTLSEILDRHERIKLLDKSLFHC